MWNGIFNKERILKNRLPRKNARQPTSVHQFLSFSTNPLTISASEFDELITQ